MVLLFSQTIDGVPYIIDEYHNSGNEIEFYVDIMALKEYKYNLTILPFDANQRELGTGRTRIETFRRHGVRNIKLLRKLSFQDSIQAARQFIDLIHIDKKCVGLIAAIQNYRKRYDDKLGVFLDKDVHDIHSNYAASLRYKAQGLSHYVLRNSVVKPEKPKIVRVSKSHRTGSTGFAV